MLKEKSLIKFGRGRGHEEDKRAGGGPRRRREGMRQRRRETDRTEKFTEEKKRNIKKLGLATQLSTSAHILIYADGEEIGWERVGNDPVTRTVEFDPRLRESSFLIRTKRVIGLFGTINNHFDWIRVDLNGTEKRI